MIVLVIVLAVVAVVAIAFILFGRSRFAKSLATSTAERDAAVSRATQAEAERDAATVRATAAEAARQTATASADEARSEATAAEQARRDAETRAAEAAERNGVDPHVLWALEQARSERTWRQSVAIGEGSFLDGVDDPLLAALQVELDAAREDVGAIVELDAELPTAVTPAGSVLVLRAAQELLARSMKTAEETTLRVRVDGDDIVVTVVATDEAGEPVPVEPLAIPGSADMAPDDGGVRILRAVVLGSPE
jgi:hypothetical protein